MRRVKSVLSFHRYLSLYFKYRNDTMIRPKPFVENLAIADSVLRHLDGAVIECGTWRGGMSAALMELGGPDRPYRFFDSFEGLPPAEEIDGKSANAYQKDTQSPSYHDNCTASIEQFKATLSKTRRTL